MTVSDKDKLYTADIDEGTEHREFEHEHDHKHGHIQSKENHTHNHNRCEHDHGHEHDHDDDDDDCCGDSCGCGHEHTKHDNQKIFVARIASAVIILLICLIVKMDERLRVALNAAAFIAAGYDIVFLGVKNLLKKRVFDENILMTVAGIGAFLIGEAPEGVLVMVLTQIGEALQEKAVSNSKKSVKKLLDLRPDTVRLLKKGEPFIVDPEEVQKGDLILVQPGERIALDGFIVSGDSELDTAALTGESLPRYVKSGDDVMSGSINLTGAITVKVTNTIHQSTVSRILKLVQSAQGQKGKSEKMITKFAKYYTPAVFAAAVIIAFIIPLIISQPVSEWIHRALVLLVISCPCALVISVPLTYFAGIGGASRNGILFKSSQVIDKLIKTTSVVFDKTGTLTTGSFAIEYAEVVDGISKDELIKTAAYAECLSGHPLAQSICRACDEKIDKTQIVKVREIRGKGMAVALKNGDIYITGNFDFLQSVNTENLVRPCESTCVLVAKNGKYIGCIYLRDTVKPSSKSTIDELEAMGITRSIMLTGDKSDEAARVSEEIGIKKFISDCLPEDKLNFVKNMMATQNKDEATIFVGDGINDVPAFATVDIGISMGGLGSDAAIEAADVIIMNDDPKKVPEAIKHATKAHKIVIQNIVFALSVKFLCMILGIFGIASMWMAVFADVGVALIAICNAMRAYGKFDFNFIRNKVEK